MTLFAVLPASANIPRASEATGLVRYDLVTAGNTSQGYDLLGDWFSDKVTGAGLTAADVTDHQGNRFDACDRLQTGALYDLNGNTTNDTGAGQATSQLYDAENRLLRQTGGGATVTLTYDADGHRARKTVGTTTACHVVETLNPSAYALAMEERSALTGDPTATCVYGLALIRRSTINAQPSTVFYGTDGVGSVRYLTDANGALTHTYTSDAFGIPIASSGGTTSHSRYTGQQWDPALGMYYLRARYYRPQLGRFWSLVVLRRCGASSYVIQRARKSLVANRRTTFYCGQGAVDSRTFSRP